MEKNQNVFWVAPSKKVGGPAPASGKRNSPSHAAAPKTAVTRRRLPQRDVVKKHREALTAREKEVLQCLANGLTTGGIVDIELLKDALDVVADRHSKLQAVVAGYRRGLLAPVSSDPNLSKTLAQDPSMKRA